MNDEATSLDRMHDIVEPSPVPWLPPAPGWYVLLAVAACLLIWYLARRWKRWHANAYRRAALRELESATTPIATAEVLRRAALSLAPRADLARLTGDQWTSWLAARAAIEMPDQVRSMLAGDVYREPNQKTDPTSLRNYAEAWIRHHHALETLDT